MPVVLPHKELSANTLQLGAFAVFCSYTAGIPGNTATNMNDREQDLDHPLASSSAGMIRTGDRCGACPIDASYQTFV